MQDRIKVLIRKVGQEAKVKEIDNTLKAMQEIVGGMIEIPYSSTLPKGVNVVVNEEGKLLDLEPNVYWGDYDVLCGDIFFTSYNRSGNAVSLTDKQIEEAKEFIQENDASSYMDDSIAINYAKLSPKNPEQFHELLKKILDEVFNEENNTTKENNSKKCDMEM